MPSELRKITFTESEVLGALFNHWLHAGTPRPRGEIVRVSVQAGDDDAILSVFHQTRSDDHPREWRVSRPEVAAAIIRYCLQKPIPLPRFARKTVEPQPNGIALLLEFEHAEK